MSKAISVNIAKRDLYGTANSRRLRRAGLIPAVVYGHGNPAQTITITPEEAAKIEYHNGLVELNCDCGEKKTAIVKEIQRHPINPGILHIDFGRQPCGTVVVVGTFGLRHVSYIIGGLGRTQRTQGQYYCQ